MKNYANKCISVMFVCSALFGTTAYCLAGTYSESPT